MLEKEKFPQDYFPEVGAGPGRAARPPRSGRSRRSVPGAWRVPGCFQGQVHWRPRTRAAPRPARLWGGGRTVSSAASCPGCPGGLWPASRRGGRRAQPGSGSAGSPAPAQRLCCPAHVRLRGAGGGEAGPRLVALGGRGVSVALAVGFFAHRTRDLDSGTSQQCQNQHSRGFLALCDPRGAPGLATPSCAVCRTTAAWEGRLPPAAPWLAELEPRAAAPRGHVPRSLPAVPESRSATGRLAPWSLLLSRRPPGLRAGARQGHNFISWLYDPSRSEGAVAPGRMGTSVTPGCGFPSIVPDRGPDVRGPASRPGCPWLSSGAWRGRCPESSGSSSSHPARAQPCLNAGGPPGDGVWRPVLRQQGLSSRCQSPVMAEHRPLPTQVHPGSPASHGAGTQGQQWRAGRLHRDSKPPACGGRGPPRLHPSAHP